MTTILVGTDDVIHQVGDESAAWLRGHAIGALARDRDAVWAVADGRELWRDAGVGTGESIALAEGHRLNCLAVSDGSVIAGTAAAHLLRLEQGSLRRIEPFERAENRARWYTPWGGPPDVRSIAAGDGTLYVNVHVGGILRSDDGGQSWSPTIEIDTDVHQVIVHPEVPTRLLAATARGLADSPDSGQTWTILTEGMHATYCRAAALAGDMVLVSCSTGPSGDRAGLYRRPLNADSGTGFERCRDGLPEWQRGNIDTACLDAVGATVAFGTAAGEVFASGDAGATWRQVAAGLPPVRCLLVLS